MPPPDIEIFVTSDPQALPARGVAVALRKTNWDDYGYRTEFDLSIAVSGEHHPIGKWKILDTEAPVARWGGDPVETQLEKRFARLSARFISLAQELDHYRTLAAIDLDVARNVLGALRDAAYLPPSGNPERIEGFVRSLTRSTHALEAYRRGRALLAELGVLGRTPVATPQDPMAFRFRYRSSTTGPYTHEVDLDFSADPRWLGLHRMWALTGANGSGKTHLLAAMARTLSGLETANTEVEPRPAFSKIIAVSYSPWDQFNRPREDKYPSYVYCGLREPGRSPRPGTEEADPHARDDAPLDLEGARKRTAGDLYRLTRDGRRERWRRAMQSCGLDREGSALADTLEHGSLIDALSRSSAGEQLAAIVITRLVRHLEPGALVLFDEPELHMHPSLLSALLRTLHELIDEQDAYAILATHSPIPLQEIPRRCVRIFDLDGSVVHTRIPDEQCFGATLGDLIANVFRGRQDDRNWARFVRGLRGQGRSRAEIVQALDGEPGLGVQMLLAALEPAEGSEP
ncbi:MAG: ATP-binding protein [Sandaracinaceae bacterium]|nr:ATP-binding protein [Sandaracinaceae bacterium]